MKNMVTRREFTKSLGGAIAIAGLNPIFSFAVDEAKVSAEAAKLYRESFILDCNALASIGRLQSQSQENEIAAAIRDSGVVAVKATLGGAIGDFAVAMADIASADQLIEKKTDLFLQVRTVADFDRARNEKKLGIIYSFESADML